MSRWKKLTREGYRCSRWSGGTTTEIAIAPTGARYAERDFLWRVSSAVVELDESDFTALPAYGRLIATLEGEICLSHDGGDWIRLRPLQVHAFDGAESTRCLGRCRDFNLMLRKGRAEGSMEALAPDGPLTLPAAAAEGPPETRLLYCAAGTCSVADGRRRERLLPGEALLTDGTGALRLDPEDGAAALMLCRIRELPEDR